MYFFMDYSLYPLQDNQLTAANINIGKNIRKRRKQLNITQKGLAQAIGVSYQQIQKYENGTNRISADRLYLLGILLGVEISYFFKDKGLLPNKGRQIASNKTRRGATAQIQMKDIDPSIRIALVNLIKTMSQTANSNSKQY